jgi:predicted AAA+ superfamily ATPase
MNKSYSQREWIYIDRWISRKIKKTLDIFPIVAVYGARQVGKSTMLKHDFPDFTYYTLDDFDTMEQSRIDPTSLWKNQKKIIIDEVQKNPQLLPFIKISVDQKEGISFLLSGSSNLLLMKTISESLAGRAIYIQMNPLTFGELKSTSLNENRLELLLSSPQSILEKSLSPEDVIPYLYKGFMPSTLLLENEEDIVLWNKSYIQTYLERDVRSIINISSLQDFRRVMTLLALRNGCIINQSDLARDAGLSQPTVFRYMQSMETLMTLDRVSPYFSNPSIRLVKSPKLFWTEPSIAIHLSGIYSQKALSNTESLGLHFESLVYHHLKVWSNMMSIPANLLYWRKRDGTEVDIVVEQYPKILPIEVKCKSKLTLNDTKNLRIFLETYPEANLGIIVYTGTELKYLLSNILAVPWQWLSGG